MHVEQLFSFVPADGKVFTPISRVVVDVERFQDDAMEDMAKIGMGWFYLKDEQGRVIRKAGATKTQCAEIYNAYHQQLSDKVAAALENHGSCWILDCHSFRPDITYTAYQPSAFPDICIGYNDEVSCSLHARESIRQLFENAGYRVAYNIPFGGCLIPTTYANDARVKGIMLELNRNSYLGQMERMTALCRSVYETLENL